MTWLLPLVAAVFGLVIWQSGVTLAHIPPVLLPPPSQIVQGLLANGPLLFADAGTTAGEALAGFVLALVGGIAIAAVMAMRPGIRNALQPHLVLFQLVPKIALGPLFITWFGLGWSSRIAFAAFVSLFPVVIGALTGFLRVDSSALRLLQACRASEWQIFRHLRAPAALPYIFSGAKIAATMAFTGATVGEFLSAQSGLGHAILDATAVSDTPLVFAALAVLCALGAALYGLVAIAEARIRAAFLGDPA